MQEKITFSQLCGLVSSRASVSRKTTEEYLRAFFNMLAEGLADNETVKIKGLGTFKTTEIAERRSVNVSTGQDIVIPAHKRISFTPAAAMAQAVNAPFAAFEAVELADDFTDEDLAAFDIDERVEEKESDKPEAQADAVVEEKGISSVDEPVTEVALAEMPDEEVPFEMIVPTSPPVEEVPVIPPAPPVEETPSIEETQQVEETFSEANPISPEIVSAANIRRKLRFTFWGGFCTALALVAIIGGNIILFWPRLLNINPWPTEPEPKFEASVTGQNQQQQVDNDIAFGDEAEKQGLMPVTEPGDEAKASPEDEEANKAAVVPVYDTITKTRYLTTMAKEHYGNYHFWPYIYEENKNFLGHPDRIRPGTRVVVPPLSKYGVDPNNPDDLREAKRKGAAIYARYQK